MYIGVIHRISDPKGFQEAEAAAMARGLPEGFDLPIHSATSDHATGICIWRGPSLQDVRQVVETVVGEFSTNEYYEVNVDGLPA
jgi:hypothetical protein